jgi:hypothetical protein
MQHNLLIIMNLFLHDGQPQGGLLPRSGPAIKPSS